MSEPAHAHGAEPFRRATNLELFLDLVFVFAVTQLATLLSHDPTLAGLGRGLLASWLVWWLWSQFAWAGTAVDVEKNTGAQVIVLATIPAALLMTVALPEAYHGHGAPFGAAYLLVQAAAIAIMGRQMWPHPERRATFLRYAVVAGAGPLLVAIGGLAPEHVRPLVWFAAAIVGIGGALLSGWRRERDPARQQWIIDPGHFSERHGLFMIICLGEVLVAAGATAFGLGDPIATAPGLVAGGFLACVLWWLYFAFIPRVTEHALAQRKPHERGTVARDLFSFGHFPIVFGIIALAVVVKHVVKHPSDPLALADRVALAISVGCVIGGFIGIHWQYNRGVAWERPLVGALAIAASVLAGPHAPGWALLVLVGLLLLVMHAFTVRRLERRLAEGRARTGEP